ncbi:MAG: L-2-amino-thiazoline-4-carboxylic acid hydrolase [Gammaproteobacteria bacterium]|nr:L-2-amino-thiazoline-4-carboxylic acid hydrolase [Gammaproteobacteria bacterium]
MAARTAALIAAGEASQREERPGEDVFDAFAGDGETYEFGYNVLSCAVCSQFAKYDAMDLVPYMCAVDDIMSERSEQGLRRTGTIALGATHCDFAYQRGRSPQPLSDQFPSRIRVKRVD